jgi:hypothetical protein
MTAVGVVEGKQRFRRVIPCLPRFDVDCADRFDRRRRSGGSVAPIGGRTVSSAIDTTTKDALALNTMMCQLYDTKRSSRRPGSEPL